MSQDEPCGRTTPRASVEGQPTFVPASISGLPAVEPTTGCSAAVSTGPPLLASARTIGLVLSRCPTLVKPHDVPLSRLLPDDTIWPVPVTPQLSVGRYESTIELRRPIHPPVSTQMSQVPAPGPARAWFAIVVFVN